VNDTLINKEKMSHCIKNVSWLYTLTVLRFNKVCCCFWIVFSYNNNYFSEDVTISQLDVLPTRELFSVVQVKNDGLHERVTQVLHSKLTPLKNDHMSRCIFNQLG